MFKKNLKSKLTFIIFSILAFSVLILPIFALGETTNSNLIQQQGDVLNQIGGQSGYGATQGADAAEAAIAEKIGNVVSMILGVLGVVFLFLVVYSGFQWMTAGGNEEKVTKARARITRATIGLIIVTMAYALSSFVINRVQTGSSGSFNCHVFDNDEDDCRNNGANNCVFFTAVEIGYNTDQCCNSESEIIDDNTKQCVPQG